MTIANFFTHVPHAIFTRASAYAKSGAVLRLTQRSISFDSITYAATVKGSAQSYHVVLETALESGEIRMHTCTRPFAGDICKNRLPTKSIRVGTRPGTLQKWQC